jgi:hypothetical protein
LKQAVEKLLADKSFYLPSPLAAAAVATAKLVKQWLDSADNIRPASAFSDKLAASLKSCFSLSLKHACEKRENVGIFHQLQSSDSFLAMWGTFLRECTAEQASPTFFQYITDVILER